MSESNRLNVIRLGLSPKCKLFRNPRGVAVFPNGHRVVYGLSEGGSDLIGFTLIEFHGKIFPIFTVFEEKGGRTKTAPHQLLFIEAVKRNGGIGAIIRNIGDAERAIDEYETALREGKN